MADIYPIAILGQVDKAKSSLPLLPTVQISGNTIDSNTIEGDINFIGIQNNIVAPARDPSALLALIDRSKLLQEDSFEYRNMLDELQSFLAARPSRRIIGLEAKLLDGDRIDLVEDALFLENRFARRLAAGQHSPSSNAMFLHCLSAINYSFTTFIRPLIAEGAKPAVIDAAIKLCVVEPIYHELTVVDCSLNVQMVRGMLYFLTGKCHIAWN
jgi:hypothetical protein